MRAGAHSDAGNTEVVLLEDVSVLRSSAGIRRRILRDASWRVGRGERWGVIGPNGAGKSTLLRIAAAEMRPSRGRAYVLGHRLGAVSMQDLRRRIGTVDPASAARFYPDQSVYEVVLTGAFGSIVMPEQPPPKAMERARWLLEIVGAAQLRTRPFVTCSEGERARVLLARALMPDAPLLALDEPAARLDLAGRAMLLQALDDLVTHHPELSTIVVTHHVEELPPTTTHLLLLADGAIVAAGPIEDVADDRAFSECFGIQLGVRRAGGRILVETARSMTESTTTDH